MTFEEKVKAMKASEVIMAMVEALTHPPIININMSTFGECKTKETRWFFGLFKTHKKICFGCAATNTICQIGDVVFTDERIQSTTGRAKLLGTDAQFLHWFEKAINELRSGWVYGYNYYAGRAELPPIMFMFKDTYGVSLGNEYTNRNLEIFIRLANIQKRYENGEREFNDDEFKLIY